MDDDPQHRLPLEWDFLHGEFSGLVSMLFRTRNIVATNCCMATVGNQTNCGAPYTSCPEPVWQGTSKKVRCVSRKPVSTFNPMGNLAGLGELSIKPLRNGSVIRGDIPT